MSHWQLMRYLQISVLWGGVHGGNGESFYGESGREIGKFSTITKIVRS